MMIMHGVVSHTTKDFEGVNSDDVPNAILLMNVMLIRMREMV